MQAPDTESPVVEIDTDFDTSADNQLGQVRLEETKLEDLMAAMDVVDSLRHDKQAVARELDEEGRRERLLTRLREMYQAQGIDVPDYVLLEGIKALEEERFKYVPVAPSWRTRLARIWVSRSRWGKPMGFLTVLAGLFSGFYVVSDVLPEQQRRAALPTQIESTTNGIIAVAKNSDVITEAIEQKKAADALLQDDNYEGASRLLSELERVNDRLLQEYRLRVVSKLNQSSGVWRIPPADPGGRNYYLIVEAVRNDGEIVPLDIVNEEDNSTKRVKTWGLRVNEQTFNQVAADKRDDGIIQKNLVGKKRRGYLQPDFDVPTSGGTITQW
ncbi:MAG: DUF6384 family protein [Pseudomonadota bacterium]